MAKQNLKDKPVHVRRGHVRKFSGKNGSVRKARMASVIVKKDKD